MSDTLKPCPCGCKAELHEDIKMSGSGQFWVQSLCGWVGPVKPEPDEAISAWSARVEAAQKRIDVSILTMRLSGNRQEHWVRITCDGRTFDVRNYSGHHLNRAEYERDTLRHVLLGEPKPDLMDEKYADPEHSAGERDQ